MYLQKVFIFLGYFISCRNFSKNQHFGGHQPNSTQNNQNIFTFYTTLIFYNLIPKSGKSYTGEASACLKNWENLSVDQWEDSLTSLEACYVL